MEILELAKVIVPILIALGGSLFVLLRWAIDRQNQATQKMWELVQTSLVGNINQISKDVGAYKVEFFDWRKRHSARMHDLEQKLAEFEKEVAGQYIKRQDWLDHAVNLEKKIDQLRNDVHKELQQIFMELTKNSGDHK